MSHSAALALQGLRTFHGDFPPASCHATETAWRGLRLAATAKGEDRGLEVEERSHFSIRDNTLYAVEFSIAEHSLSAAASDEASIRAHAIHLLAVGIRRSARISRKIKLIFKLPCRGLSDPFVLDAFKLLRHIHDVRPDRFIVKVDEAVFAADAGKARHALDRLRSEGMHIVVDDFGAGPSPFAFLHAGDFMGVSMDASFIRDVLAGEAAAIAICGLLRNLAEDFRLMLFAAGSADDAAMAVLAGQGFDVAIAAEDEGEDDQPARRYRNYGPRKLTAGKLKLGGNTK